MRHPLRTLAGTALAWLLSPVLLTLGYVLRRAEAPCPEASRKPSAADLARGASVHETCYKCGRPADERIAERRRKLAERNPSTAPLVARLRPVCSVCAWENLQAALSEDSDTEDIAAMTDEEVDATLRGQGVDVDAFVERMRKAVAEAKMNAGGMS